jgi:patatin-like phospholipase/acyl hydrolase
MKIETKDEIVLAVLKKMDERSIIGQEKYGATMMEEIVGQKKDLNRFLIDVQEELMDALLYIEAAKRCLKDEVEETLLNQRMDIIGQNGNNGDHYNIEVNEEKGW